jgi:hypothetical protein
VVIDENKDILVQTKCLPNTIAEQEAGVHHRDLGIWTPKQLTVN